MTIFYLIRHGETDWNRNKRWQGHADEPLNDMGRAQSYRLAARLRAENVRFDAIYSSDLQRAWESASIIGAAVERPPQPLLALREIDVGWWSGLTEAEVAAQDPETFARLTSGEDVARGGAERRLDLYTRVIGAIEHLIDEHPDQTLAIITHGGPVRMILLHAARDKVGAVPPHMHIGNTSISIVIGDRKGWDIGCINNMDHLEGDSQAPDLMSAPPDDAE